MALTPKELALFWIKIDRRGADECWPWLASKKPRGYGQYMAAGKNNYAHRLVYEIEVGPIPEGLQIDHICRRRDCVNPAHLRAVTHLENHQNLGDAGRADNLSSGHRGVTWDKARRKWAVSTMYRQKSYHGGRYDDLDDAVAAAKALRLRVRSIE